MPAAAPARAARAPRAVQSIVGGTSASIRSFPFQAALYNPTAGTPAAGFFCGGVIVDATHVITAAHCLAGVGAGSVAGEVAVLAGSTRLDQPEPGSVRDAAAAVSIDPSYRPLSSDYDIGVITLAHPLWPDANAPSADGTSTIAPLPIDVAAAARYGEPNATPASVATISGWGDTNPAPAHQLSYPSALRAVSVPLVSAGTCLQQYAQIALTITPRMICAGSASPQADSCYGDSGGPLVVDRASPARPPGDYVLIGLVDFGEGCAQPGYAGVYTRIADRAIARYLASGVGRDARVSSRPADRKKKRRRQKRACETAMCD